MHAPGFAAVAILTLALGIGANTTIFSVMHAVLLRPLPYADPSRLVNVGEAGRTATPERLDSRPWSTGASETQSFEDLALVRTWTPTLVTSGEPERIPGVRVTANYFGLLGIKPAIGRDFTPDEDRPNSLARRHHQRRSVAPAIQRGSRRSSDARFG